MGLRSINRNMPDMQAPAGGAMPKPGKGGRLGGTVAPVPGLQPNKQQKEMKDAGAIPNAQGGGPVPPNMGASPRSPVGGLSPEIMAQLMQFLKGQGR
jgi:hypothetical protein